MRTQTIEVYSFNELSDDAKEHARDKYREKNYEIDWQIELFQSLMAVYKAANIKVKDYSLGLNSYSYMKLDMDDNVKDLEGSRALAWLENNLFYKLRITRAEYLKNRKAYFGYGKHYRIGCVKACPLTGVCFDVDFLDDLQNSVKNGMCLGDAFKGLADTYVKLLQSEYDAQNSDEYIDEHLEINGYEFTEDGNFY